MAVIETQCEPAGESVKGGRETEKTGLSAAGYKEEKAEGGNLRPESQGERRSSQNEPAGGGLLEGGIRVHLDVQGVDRFSGTPVVAGEQGRFVDGVDGHGLLALAENAGDEFAEGGLPEYRG